MGHAEYLESLANKASLQQLGAWLVELALMDYQNRMPYSYYGDGPKPDSLFETATRWGLNVESIKAAVNEPTKRSATKGKRRKNSAAN